MVLIKYKIILLKIEDIKKLDDSITTGNGKNIWYYSIYYCYKWKVWML